MRRTLTNEIDHLRDMEETMAVWLIRAGSHGEYELKFVQESRVYLTWDNLNVNLGKLADRSDLTDALRQRYPGRVAA
jgi:predicted Mrr-cat superfamily restriction endonuclease